MKGKARETATAAITKAPRRAKRKHIERDTRRDDEHGRRMTMVDPWSMLIEQFLGEATEGTVEKGGTENGRPAARAQGEAGSASKPERSKKRGRKQ